MISNNLFIDKKCHIQSFFSKFLVSDIIFYIKFEFVDYLVSYNILLRFL